MFLFLCIGALRYSVGRRGWRCICSQKAHENSITVSDYVSFSLIRICNIRLLYKLKMKIWWPIPSTPLTKDKNFYSWSSQNFEVIMETSASLSDLRWLWLIVIQPRVFLIFLVSLPGTCISFLNGLLAAGLMKMSSWLLI